MTSEVFAPAKINLTLHVTGQRADGYHLLDSLVVFTDIGDTVHVAPAPELTLTIEGPEAQGLRAEPDNLVLRAARLLVGEGAAVTLTKRLPVSSGIGGGSTDAAASLKALARLWDCPLPSAEAVLSLGADVPVCLAAEPTRMSGIGETLGPVPVLPDMEIVLLNPRVAVPTPAVFRALERKTNPPMPAALPAWPGFDRFVAWLRTQRNDLEPAAIAQAPVIADVLTALRSTDCAFAGMSGSGATCFGLFPADGHSAQTAASELRRACPQWWSAAGRVL